jgi:hypothetical protein
MNGTPEQREQIELAMMVVGFIVVSIIVAFSLSLVYEIPQAYQKRYAQDTPESQYVLKKATQKTLNFLLVAYAFLLPLTFALLYIVKSIIVLHPCGVLLVATCMVVKGTKENYMDDFKKEYEKLHPNNS